MLSQSLVENEAGENAELEREQIDKEKRRESPPAAR